MRATTAQTTIKLQAAWLTRPRTIPNLSASTGLTVFNGFRDFFGLRAARYARTAGYRRLDQAAQTTVFTVTSDFVALVSHQEQLRVLREELADETHLREQIEHYVSAGARSASDLYQQEATVSWLRVWR